MVTPVQDRLSPAELKAALMAIFDLEANTATAVIDALMILKVQKQRADEALKTQADLLALPRCSGTASWNDSDAYAGRYLYVIHGMGVACPFHGQPKPGRRIRKGHGSDPAAQQPVLEAMANWEAWQTAQKQAQQAVSDYTTLKLKIKKLSAGEQR